MIDFKRDAIILSHDGHGNPAMAAKESDVAIKHSIYYEGVNGFGAGLGVCLRCWSGDQPGLVQVDQTLAIDRI